MATPMSVKSDVTVDNDEQVVPEVLGMATPKSVKSDSDVTVDGDDDERVLPVSILVNIDTLINLTKNGYNRQEEGAAQQLLKAVITKLDELRCAIVELEKSQMQEYAKKILEQEPNLIAMLAPFMLKVYKSLSNGYELQCLINWTFFVLVLANCSQEMCTEIVKQAVHIQLIIQLIDLPSASTAHQEILADLVHLSMLTILVLIEHRELRRHFKNCSYTDILISYLPSKNFSIGKLAKISLALLHRHINKTKAEKYLRLSTKDVEIVFKILSDQELSEDEKKEFWHVLSKDGLAYMLKNFCCIQENCDMIVHQDGLHMLTNLINSTDSDFMEGVLLLLWKLVPSCLDDPSRATSITEKLQQWNYSDKEELQALLTCVCYAFRDFIPESDDHCVLYVEKAYKYELYEECIKFCQRKDQKATMKDRLVIFQGKSLYHIFMQDLEGLKNIPTTTSSYSKARLSCYKKIKDVIQLLGHAFDRNIIDDEGSRMLDTAMMIFLSESRNIAGKLPRCLLCRRQKKLAKSHICPKAVLDDFAKGVGVPHSGKAYFVGWPWQKMYIGNLKSAGEITIRLLCHDCELLLSKAEAKFLPHFFRNLYNVERPESISEEQVIEYQEWLYQFCVGLIFRGMTLQYSGGRSEFFNEDEVYSLFVQCRNALLHPNSDDHPDVSIFIAPTKGDLSEIESSLINICIHYPFHFFFTHKQYMYGSHELYIDALSYTFQIGMILTTVELSKANWSINPGLSIQHKSGMYKIPFDNERRQMIPDDLWETLLAEAKTVEKEVMEQPKKAIELQPLDDLLSVPPASYMLDILNISTQNKSIGKGSSLSGHPKVINFMPDEYVVSHPTAKNTVGTVDLPSTHKILLHLNVTSESLDEGSTAFIAVGDSKSPYTIDSPYLIFHQYELGLQTNTAFFFSTQSFEFVRYLPEPNPKRFLGDAATTDLIKKSGEIVSLVLKSKGYRNYHSLLYWLNSKKGPDLFDMKCSNGCWYCRNLCEICLERAILGPSLSAANDKTLKFCSQECIKFYEVNPEPHSLIFSPEDQSSDDLKVPKGHKEYIRLYSNGKLEDGGYFLTSLSLCEGNGSEDFPLGGFYVNYYLRTPDYQCHFEYFVNDNLQPLDAVVYTGSSMNLFDEDDCEDIKQSSIDILQRIFMNSHLSTISQFFQQVNVLKLLMSIPDSVILGLTEDVISNSPRQDEEFTSHGNQVEQTFGSNKEVVHCKLDREDEISSTTDGTDIREDQNEDSSETSMQSEVKRDKDDNEDKLLTQEEYENHPCLVS